MWSRLVRPDYRVCEDLSLLLAESVDTPDSLSSESKAHLECCLRCQAELAHYRTILRGMKSLRFEQSEAGSELLADVLDLVRPPASIHRLHRPDRRRAYLGGIAAAATAGAAGAIVLASRVAVGRRLAS